MQRPAGSIVKATILLVGVCLIGTAFHVHQLHPDYRLQDSNVSHHLTVDQPDCVACMHLMQAIPAIDDSGNIIRHESTLCTALVDQTSPVGYVSNLNNKSPPANC